MKRLFTVLALLLFAPSAASGAVVDRRAGALNSLEAAVGRCVGKPYLLSAQRDALRFDRFFNAAPGHQVLRAAFPKMDLPVITIAASLDPPGGYSLVMSLPTAMSLCCNARVARWRGDSPHTGS